MSDYKKMKPVFKILIVLVIIAALAFGVYNIIWLIFFNQHVKPFRDAIGYDEMRQSYIYIDEDKYTYGISYYYLSFDAELQISEVQSDEDPIQSLMNITVTSDSYDFNAVVNYQNDEKNEYGDPQYDNYYFHLNKDIQLVDSEGNVIKNLSDEEKDQYDKAYPELKILFDKANAMWSGLNS